MPRIKDLVNVGFPGRQAKIIASQDGWVEVDETWSYASATTITVPTGAASRFQVGDKLRLTQTTVKYFYVVAVADTVLTVTGGSDYAVANEAISLIAYSRCERPFGFPDFFSYTPTIGNVMGSDIGYARFSIKGKLVSVEVQVKVNATNQVVTVTCPTAINNNNHAAYGHVEAGAGWKTGLVTIIKTGATINFQLYDGTNLNGINCYVFGGAHYEIG